MKTNYRNSHQILAQHSHISYQPELQKVLGVTPKLMAGLEFLTKHFTKKGKYYVEKDGKGWLRCANDCLAKILYCSLSTVKRIISAGKKLGIITIKYFDSWRGDRRSWIHVDIERLKELLSHFSDLNLPHQAAETKASDAPPHRLKMSLSSAQNEPVSLIYNNTNNIITPKSSFDEPVDNSSLLASSPDGALAESISHTTEKTLEEWNQIVDSASIGWEKNILTRFRDRIYPKEKNNDISHTINYSNNNSSIPEISQEDLDFRERWNESKKKYSNYAKEIANYGRSCFKNSIFTTASSLPRNMGITRSN